MYMRFLYRLLSRNFSSINTEARECASFHSTIVVFLFRSFVLSQVRACLLVFRRPSSAAGITWLLDSVSFFSSTAFNFLFLRSQPRRFHTPVTIPNVATTPSTPPIKVQYVCSPFYVLCTFPTISSQLFIALSISMS